MPLTDTAIRNVKPKDRQYKLSDEKGLYLLVKESGKKLINQTFGFTKIIADSAQINETIIIAVHGYESEGYEWVSSLNNLAEEYSNTYFYRYDWDICPDSLGYNLADSIVALIQDVSQLNKIIIFGHSYGGLVVTYLASNLDFIIPIEMIFRMCCIFFLFIKSANVILISEKGNILQLKIQYNNDFLLCVTIRL